MRRIVPLLVCLALAGCVTEASTGKSDGTGYTPGKADGVFEIAEVGPLDFEAPLDVTADGRLEAYRVESYGGTRVSIDLAGLDGTDAYVVVEGPLAGDGDATAPGSAEVIAKDDDGGDGLNAHLDVTLDAPGVYRVLAGTYESLGKGEVPRDGRLRLEAQCTDACGRPSIPARDLVIQMRESGQLDALLAQFDGQIATLVPDETQRGAIRAQLDAFVGSLDADTPMRFPTLPLRQLGTVRAALGGLNAEPPAADEVVTGELASVLGACDVPRSYPSPVNAALPGLGNGHFPNRALTACQVAHSKRLAQALTSLAANNGSKITYRGVEHTTPASLVEALLQAGHTIEVRNERTYANFISLTMGDRDVIWPVWLDTGEEMGGAPLTVPMGHSGHAWRIHGPDVDARIMFYLGIDGAAFFAQTQTRPAWTGEVVNDGASSTEPGGAELVVQTVEVATAYLQRIHVERATVAAGMPADGYGYVGVCNDSNALIEYVTRGTVTTFPLMRAAALDDAERLNDGLDDAIRALPHDGDIAPARRDLLERVLLMTPHDLDSPLLVDDALRGQLVAAKNELFGG